MRQLPRLTSAIGKQFRVRDEVISDKKMSRENLLHFALSTGNLDPLFFDPEYAEAAPHARFLPPLTWFTQLIDPNVGAQALYTGLVRPSVEYVGDEPDPAPPVDSGPPLHFLDGLRSFNAALSYRRVSPPRIGDTFTIDGEVSSVVEKKSRRFGSFAIVRSDITIHGSDGVPVATGYGSSIVYDFDSLVAENPLGDQGDGRVNSADPVSPAEAIAQVERRGQVPLYEDDVELGDLIRPLYKGTLDEAEIAVYSVKWGANPAADVDIEKAWSLLERGDGVRAARLYREIAMNPEYGFGVQRHVNVSEAKSEGAPGAYDIGTQRAAWVAQAVTDWMGTSGVIVALEVEIRGFLVVGDDAWCKGVVTGKTSVEAGVLVTLDVWVENQRGVKVTTGRAEVILPRRS